jgi:hypothetical protein
MTRPKITNMTYNNAKRRYDDTTIQRIENKTNDNQKKSRKRGQEDKKANKKRQRTIRHPRTSSIKNFDHHLQYAERDTKQISLPGQEAFFLSTAFSAWVSRDTNSARRIVRVNRTMQKVTCQLHLIINPVQIP